MTVDHLFDLLPEELASAGGLDSEARQRLVFGLLRHIDEEEVRALAVRSVPAPPVHRWRRRSAAAVFVVTVVGVGLGVGLTSSNGPRGRGVESPPASSTTVVRPVTPPLPLRDWVLVTQDLPPASQRITDFVLGNALGPLRAVDAASGGAVGLGLPTGPGENVLPIADTGGTLLVDVNGSGGSVLRGSLAVLTPGAGAARRIAPENRLNGATLSSDGQGIWTTGLVVAGQRSCTIEELSLDGAVLVPPADVPCAGSVGRTVIAPNPVAGAGAGVVLAANGTLEYFDPASRSTVRISGPLSQYLGTIGDDDPVFTQTAPICVYASCLRVGWATAIDVASEQWDLSRPDVPGGSSRLGEPASPERLGVPRPDVPSGSFELGQPAFSPAGPEDAVLVSADNAVVDADTPSGPGQLLIEDPFTGQVLSSRQLTVSSAALVAWSPDGRYVFVARDADHVEAVPTWSATAPITLVKVPAPFTQLWVARLG
jgi:hypothetical protein